MDVGRQAMSVTWRIVRLKVAGAVLILLVAAVVAVAVAMYAGSFRSTETVTVETSRTGLVLDPDAKVRMRGWNWAGSAPWNSMVTGRACVSRSIPRCCGWCPPTRR